MQTYALGGVKLNGDPNKIHVSVQPRALTASRKPLELVSKRWVSHEMTLACNLKRQLKIKNI